MKERERVRIILERLDAQYTTEYRCYLNYETPWQLLFATMLSAQCTDARVNLVTKDLFVKYPTVQAFAEASQEEMEQDIRTVGFFHDKARNLIACAKMLTERFGGEVPRGIDELVQLPGVGRKTANVIRGNIFHEPSIVVDTHVKRIAGKLGLTTETEPEKVERALMKVLPEDHWILFNIHIITLGRSICTARNPQCADCFLQDVCPAGRTQGRPEARR